MTTKVQIPDEQPHKTGWKVKTGCWAHKYCSSKRWGCSGY